MISIVLDQIDIRMIEYNVEQFGIEECFIKLFKHMDCSTTYDDGTRPMQSIGYPYARIKAEFDYLIKKLMADYTDTDKVTGLCNIYNEIHNNNIKYEKDNPPIHYKNKRAVTKKVTKTNISLFKDEEVEVKPKKVKETIASRKAAYKENEITKIGFKLKLK